MLSVTIFSDGFEGGGLAGWSTRTYSGGGGAPTGLKLNARTGILSGTARKAGTYKVTVRVTDKLGVEAKSTLVLKVR